MCSRYILSRHDLPLHSLYPKDPVLDSSNRLISEVLKLLGTTSSFGVAFQLLEEGVFFCLFLVYFHPPSLHLSVLLRPASCLCLCGVNRSQWEHRVPLLSIHLWLGALLLPPWYRLVACVSIMTCACGHPPSSTPPTIHPSSYLPAGSQRAPTCVGFSALTAARDAQQANFSLDLIIYLYYL